MKPEKKPDANDRLRAGVLPPTPFDLEPPDREAPPFPGEEGSKKGEPMPKPNPYQEVRERVFDGVRRLSTGFPILDRHLSERGDEGDETVQRGLVIPSLVVLGASPKAGKSSWAQRVVEHQIEENRHVLVLDFENGAERWFRRLLCRRATKALGGPTRLGGKGHVAPSTLPHLRSDKSKRAFSRDHHEAVEATERWIHEALDSGRLTYRTERNMVAEGLKKMLDEHAARALGPTLVLVDSLQRLPATNANDRRASIDAWLDVLETATQQNKDLVVLVISELKRAPAGGSYDLTDSAFKESGRIEYAGACLLGLEPLEVGDEDAASRISVIMDRDGKAGPRIAKYVSRYPYYGLDEREVDTDDETKGEKKTREASEKKKRKAKNVVVVPGEMVEVIDPATSPKPSKPNGKKPETWPGAD